MWSIYKTWNLVICAVHCHAPTVAPLVLTPISTVKKYIIILTRNQSINRLNITKVNLKENWLTLPVKLLERESRTNLLTWNRPPHPLRIPWQGRAGLSTNLEQVSPFSEDSLARESRTNLLTWNRPPHSLRIPWQGRAGLINWPGTDLPILWGFLGKGEQDYLLT